jgi:hypothetical protein
MENAMGALEQWVELGENNISYFLGLEKKSQFKKSINKLKNENNEIATEQGEILEYFHLIQPTVPVPPLHFPYKFILVLFLF